MSKSAISVRRIVVALLLVLSPIGALTVTFMAGQHVGKYQQRIQTWSREVRGSGWSPSRYEAAGLEAVAAWGVLEQQPGNALSLYWPAGVSDAETPCARAWTGGFDSPSWNVERSHWREAATCARLDEIVRAAHLDGLDMTDWLRHAPPGAIPGPDSHLDLSRAPIHEITALIARSHLRILDGDLDQAEADARAAVSAGLHFMHGSYNVEGMQWASITITSALDHLREVYERRGDDAAVTDVMAAAERVRLARSALSRYSMMVPRAAATPQGMNRVVAIATNPGNPLGLRTHAAMMLGYGYLLNPAEALLGPSEERLSALAAVEQQGDLAPVVARVRETFAMPLRKRLDVHGQLAAVY